MSKLPLLSILAATAAAGMLFKAWDWNATMSPEQLLEEAQVLADGDPPQSGLAQRKLQRALDLGPSKATRLAITKERAEIYLRDRSYNLALREYELLLLENPDSIEILDNLASIALSLDNTDLTVDYLNRTLAIFPTNSWARAKKAKEQDKLAQAIEARIEEQLLAYLPESKLNVILPMIQQASYLPLADPARIGVIDRLQADLANRSPESLPIAINGIAELAEVRSLAREAYTSSLKYSVNKHNLHGFLSHMRSSGRVHDAVDFGLVLPFFKASIEHPGTLQDLALSLESLGRSRPARTIIKNAIAEDATWKNDFLEPWCGILYRSELWPQLRSAAVQLHRKSGVSVEKRSVRARASFFWGIAEFNLGEPVTAEDHLGRFLNIRPADALPESLPAAWLAMADIYKARGDTVEERRALIGCIEEQPRFSIDVYLRAAESIRSHKQRGLEAAEYLAQAISMDSSLEAELLPIFEAAGEQQLEETRVSLNALIQKLMKKDRWYPTGEDSTYTLWALAQIYHERGQLSGALVTYRRLRKTMPGFAPAYRQESVILKTQGRSLEQMTTLLESMEWNGPNPESIREMKAILAVIGDGKLEGTTLRKWMELDPSFAGAIEIAKELQRTDRIEEALFALSGTDRGLFTDTDSILYGEVLTSLNRYEEVLASTAEIDPQGPLGGTGALIRARAALFLNQGALLEQSLADIEKYDPELDEHLIHEVLGLMNAGGLEEQAMRMARHLATSTKTHSGRNLNLAAATAANSSDLESARSWVELANAFLTDMSPTAGLLLISIQEGKYDDVPALARQLRDGDYEWSTATHPALLAALEGRLGEARAQTLAGLERTPYNVDFHLLGAALNSIGAVPIDGNTLGAGLGKPAGPPLARISSLPKEAGLEMVAMLLAKDTPGWSAWTNARLGLPTHRMLLGPFGREMLARSTMDSDEYLLARNMVDLSIKRWLEFIPFWDLLEELAILEYGTDSPKVVAAKLRRRRKGLPLRGGGEATEIDLLLDAAAMAAAGGDSRKALQLARQAQVLDGNSLPVRLAVARQARELDPIAALNGYKGYLVVATGPEVPAAIEEMFELFSMRVGMNPNAEEIRIQRLLLENLELKSPDDPLPVIELARLDILEGSISNPQVAKAGPASPDAPEVETGIQTALERMQRFFRSHRDESLEALRPGSCEAWFSLLATFDPYAAHRFADEQLDLSPRSIDLWILYARSLEATSQMELALETWLRICKMTADPKVALATASLMSQLDGKLSEIDLLLDLAGSSDDPSQFRRRIGFIRGKSHIQVGGASITKGIEILTVLSATEPEYPGDVTHQEIDYALSLGLLSRAEAGDGARAKSLLEPLAEMEKDPLRAQLLLALAGLGKSLGPELARHLKAEQLALESEDI
ncbi:MAG: tetratricopeptide (TPR) repeat protein [Planctomycetota bacterium]|jgi:tetratricopeptide (TPR) repeat protein